MTALLTLLAAISVAAARPDDEFKTLNHPKASSETAKKNAKHAGWEAIYGRIIEAAQAPDFTMWWTAPLPESMPKFVVVESAADLAHMSYHGALSQIRVFDPPFDFRTRNDDEKAFIMAHEVIHYLDWAANPRDARSFHARCVDDFVPWLEKNAPKVHAKWRRRAETAAAKPEKAQQDFINRLGRAEFIKRSMQHACSSHAPDDLAAFIRWGDETIKTVMSEAREGEVLADHWAWKLTELAGYNPRRGYLFFDRRGSQESAGDWARFESHYPSSLRAEELKRYADSKFQWMPPSGGKP